MKARLISFFLLSPVRLVLAEVLALKSLRMVSQGHSNWHGEAYLLSDNEKQILRMGFQNCPRTLETIADECIVQAEKGELGALNYFVGRLQWVHGTKAPRFRQLDP